MGYRKVVFWPCAYTSLGDLGKSTMKSINAAGGFVKLKGKAEAQRGRRHDGLTPAGQLYERPLVRTL
jgi:hypothetical protein